jgi:hypothetical protein
MRREPKRCRGVPGVRLLVGLVLGVAVFGIATAIYASIPAANGVIHGCYNGSDRASGTAGHPGPAGRAGPAGSEG